MQANAKVKLMRAVTVCQLLEGSLPGVQTHVTGERLA
jgi:hypothetical protein